MITFRQHLLYLPLNITLESQKFLNGQIIWLTNLPNLMPKKLLGTKELFTTKEIFLKREGALTRKGKLLIYNDMGPYLKYYFTIKNTLRQTHSQNLNYLKTKLKPNLIGLSVKYKKVLNVRGGGYKFILSNGTLILELGYSHKILLIWPASISNLKLSRRENALQVKSYDIGLLTSLLTNLKTIRSLNVYTRKGMKYKNELFNYKQVKRKKFL